MMVSWKLPGNLERPTPLMPASKLYGYDYGKCVLTLDLSQDVMKEIQKIRPGGLDFAFECTGRYFLRLKLHKKVNAGKEASLAASLGNLHPGWGSAVLVGLPTLGTKIKVLALPFILQVIFYNRCKPIRASTDSFNFANHVFPGFDNERMLFGRI